MLLNVLGKERPQSVFEQHRKLHLKKKLLPIALTIAILLARAAWSLLVQDALNSIQAFDSLQGPYFSVYKCHPMCWWLIYHYRSARPGAEFSLRGLTVMDLSVEHHTDWFHVPADVCFGAHAVHWETRRKQQSGLNPHLHCVVTTNIELKRRWMTFCNEVESHLFEWVLHIILRKAILLDVIKQVPPVNPHGSGVLPRGYGLGDQVSHFALYCTAF